MTSHSIVFEEKIFAIDQKIKDWPSFFKAIKMLNDEAQLPTPDETISSSNIQYALPMMVRTVLLGCSQILFEDPKVVIN